MNEFFKKPLVKILMLKGETGSNIKDIKKTSTSGLVDTYTVTLDNGETTTFKVTNGKDSVLSKLDPIRQTSANVETSNDSNIKLFFASSSMKEGKPDGEGYILQFAWDTYGWDAQLFIPSDHGTIATRYMRQGNWGDWEKVYSENFKPTLDDIGLTAITNSEIDTIVG